MSVVTDERPAALRPGIGGIAIAFLGFGWVALAALWAVPGVFSLDGFVYHAMIDAFARNGSLFVDNGLGTYDSSALNLSLMREAGDRLAPQYPGGWGILAAPAYLAAGLRGVIVVNALASALTLPLVWIAARALFDDRALATQAALIWGLATFAVDYAFGVWPHAVATCLVTAAVAAVATGWRDGPAAELRGALVAGLALGLGSHARVDALIAAVPLAVWLLTTARRPYGALGLLLLGLAPGLAAAAAINHAKFGTFSPVSYGHAGGKVSLGYYAGLLPLAAAGAALALGLGVARVRAWLLRPAALAATGLGLLAIALAVAPTREALVRVAAGFWVLVVDFQVHSLPARGLEEGPDGTVRVFGLIKKALLQSLPYVAAIPVLMPRLWRGPDRAAIGFCALFVVLSIVPFAFGSWHGGRATNMRYFLNFLPVLAILAAAALREIAAMADGHRLAAPAAVVGIGGAAVLYAAARGYPFDVAFQLTLPNAVAAATAAAAVLVLATRGAPRHTLAAALRGLVAFGLMIAFVSAWVFDVQVTRQVRARNAEIARLTGDLPRDALVVTYAPAAAGFRLNRPPALTAETELSDRAIYPALEALVRRAVAEERPVFVQGRPIAEMMVEKGLADGFAARYGIGERFDLHEMAPPPGR